jgi:hypothetical protein
MALAASTPDLVRALSEQDVGKGLSRRLIPWDEMPD